MENKKREIIELMDDMKEEDLNFLIWFIKMKKTKDKTTNIESSEEVDDIWKQAMILIEKELTEVSFNTWLKPIMPLNIENNTIILYMPNEFHMNIIEERYTKLLKNALYYVTDRDWELEYRVRA